MPSSRLLAAVSALLNSFAFALVLPVAAHAQDSVQDCLGVLAKDYYSIASSSNLNEDFLRSIDSEAWQQLQKSNSFSGSGFGIALSDDYKTFDEKRNKYLERVHYSRTQQQAQEILEITTADRAYPAYEACLRAVSGGGGLRVWISRETMDTIELRVLYKNPPNVNHMGLQGFLTGGTVSKAPKGRLWAGVKNWGVMQEKIFTIQRAPGTATTTMIVVADDGSSPVSLTSKRADGLLALLHPGTTDVFRQVRSASAQSPNNNDNRGHCANEVGRSDTNVCVSRTTASLSTSAPRFFKEGDVHCSGPACPWARTSSATISNNGLSISGHVDNWGSPVTVELRAKEYEHLTSTQCQNDGPIPVVFGQAVVFTTPSDCLPISTLQWTLLPSRSQGVVHFSDLSSPEGRVVIDGNILNNGSVVQVAYKLAQ